MTHEVIFSPESSEQLEVLYDYIADKSSARIAWRFVNAIVTACEKLTILPERGTKRDDIRPGLRTMGFRRRVTIAFFVQDRKVFIVGIFYGGQNFEAILREQG